MFAVIYWSKTKLTILLLFILGSLTAFSAAVMLQSLQRNWITWKNAITK